MTIVARDKVTNMTLWVATEIKLIKYSTENYIPMVNMYKITDKEKEIFIGELNFTKANYEILD